MGLGCLPGFGKLLAVLYLVLRDACFQGQSIGKRIFELRVVDRATQQPCSLGRLCARNVLWLVPIVNIVFAIAAAWLIVHEGSGRHWGDRLADTHVVSATS